MVTQDLIYDGNGSKESILYPSSRHSAAGEVYGPTIRGLDLERGADTITVASSFNAMDDDEKIRKFTFQGVEVARVKLTLRQRYIEDRGS
jgi:hypothetical protein